MIPICHFKTVHDAIYLANKKQKIEQKVDTDFMRLDINKMNEIESYESNSIYILSQNEINKINENIAKERLKQSKTEIPIVRKPVSENPFNFPKLSSSILIKDVKQKPMSVEKQLAQQSLKESNQIILKYGYKEENELSLSWSKVLSNIIQNRKDVELSDFYLHPVVHWEDWKKCMMKSKVHLSFMSHLLEDCRCPIWHEWICPNTYTCIMKPHSNMKWLALPIELQSNTKRKLYMLCFINRIDQSIFIWAPHWFELPSEISTTMTPFVSYVQSMLKAWKFSYTICPLRQYKESEHLKDYDSLDYYYVLFVIYIHVAHSNQLWLTVHNPMKSNTMKHDTGLKILDKTIKLNLVSLQLEKKKDKISSKEEFIHLLEHGNETSIKLFHTLIQKSLTN
jgi:hypothetical protein